ncbi:MAG: ATP-binding cassette domain-containing protein [Acidobacteria bacterium]|nr:ATP-binding cassette domain-containing protein [Acidobacteriota bacterium]MBI3488881.1 ATP-binding cassette domain-containing protein [Acidobacteriota bacterium]
MASPEVAGGTGALLGLSNLWLTQGAHRILEGATLDIAPGEIHALVGDRGSGKSSLAAIATGFLRPDAGFLRIDGGSHPFFTRKQAARLGIEWVAQQPALFDGLTVAENILLDGRGLPWPIRSRKQLEKEAGEILSTLDLAIDPSAKLGELDLSGKVLVDLARNLRRNPRLLILDEAMEKLSAEALTQTQALLRRLGERGLAILHITHRMDDLFAFAHRVTVLREGRVLFSDAVEHVDRVTLVRLAYTQLLRHEAIERDAGFARLIQYNEAILTSLPVNLMVVDMDLRPVLVNRCARELFAPQLPGRAASLAQCVGERNQGIVPLLESACREAGASSFYRVPFFARNGERIHTIKTDPILDGGHRIGTLIILEDVTEQERLREQAVLSGNLASLGLLTAGVAHEINNPLDIIGYYLQHIRFSTADAEILKAATSIEEEVEAIAAIVDSLISFSDKKPRHPERFDLARLAEDLVELLRFGAERGGVAVSCLREPAPLFVRADRNEIRQVLLNLFRNAFEAMPDGGGLEVECRTVGGHALVSVCDTGPGIEPSRLAEIFLPFYSTKEGGGKNSGLGLSISYGIVSRHGGGLAAENRARGGACFKMTLPLVGGDSV